MTWRLVVVVACVACSASDDIPAPQIAAVTPNHAAPGSVVVVTGSDLCQQPEDSEDPFACANIGVVLFGVTAGTSTQYTDTSIMVDTPNGTGTVRVVVSSAGRTSNGIDFTFE